MSLDEINDGRTIFIDTNVLIYARTSRSEECRKFLARCHSREVNGVISSFVVAEFCHRRMMQEAQTATRLTSNPAKALAKRPEIVRNLLVYADDVRALISGELALIHSEKTDFAVALEIQRYFGLLTIDSINLAIARRVGISEIATADANFDHVTGIMVRKPSDVRV